MTINDRAGFIANALLFGYLNHAVAHVRGALRHPRGHRRRDEARLRPADGPARADGPDRPGHRVRDPGHHVPPRRPGPPPRPGAADQADGHRRAARPQVAAGASTPTRSPGSPVVVPDEQTPAGRGRRGSPTARAPIAKVGVVGSGTMAAGIVEVFAKAGYEVVSVTRGAEKSAEGLRGGQDLAEQGRGAGQAHRGRPGRRPGPDHLVGHAGPSGRRRPGGRGGGRGAERQEGAVRHASTRSASRASCSPPPPPACR